MMITENIRILVVDDEQDYCDVLKMILEAKGYQVMTCNNGQEALELLEKHSFDVVVSYPRAFISNKSSCPSITGILRSDTTTSKLCFSNNSSASCPLLHVIT